MYRSPMWSNLFRPAPTVFDAYAQTSNALNTLRQNQIKNAMSQINLNAAPQLMNQALQQGAAKTSVMQNTAQYAPQLSALDVQQKQILNAMNSQKFQEQPIAFQQGMALKAAQLEQIKQNMLLAPQKLQQQQGRFGAPYQLAKIMSTLTPAGKAALVAANPNEMNQVYQTAISKAAGQSGLPMGVPAQNALSPLPPPMDQGAPPQPIIAPNQGLPPPSGPSAPSGAQQLPFAVASQIAANKSSVTSPTTKRLESAVEIEKILNNPANDAMAANAAKYAGIGGKISGGMQAWSKQNPKDYEDYIQFHNQYTSMIANLMRQVEGLGVQESTRNEIRGNILQSFDTMSGNPQRAMDQYYRLKDQMTQIARAASTAAQPVFPGVRERQAGLGASSPSESSQTVEVINPQGQRGTIAVGELRAALKGGWSLG